MKVARAISQPGQARRILRDPQSLEGLLHAPRSGCHACAYVLGKVLHPPHLITMGGLASMAEPVGVMSTARVESKNAAQLLAFSASHHSAAKAVRCCSVSAQELVDQHCNPACWHHNAEV